MKGYIRLTDREIAEMAKAMGDFELKDTVKCDIELSEHLFAKGYRKQSDTVKEFVRKVLQIESKRPLCLFNEYKEGYTDCLDQIKELAAEYGAEVEDEV